ncbi:MAG: alpha/beta fold hydrolase [Pseudonocardia sp.]|nr:alpha/beta fold hydrolase [Pseudonocardia sp.]
MRGRRRAVIGLGSVAVCIAVAVAVPATARAQEGNCRDVSVPVSVPAAVSVPVVGPQPSMHGVYCRAVGDSKHVVQVLVPGATYSHIYWDFGYRPDTYNFRLAMNRAGFDTLTVDRLGTGSSSRPPSALVTSIGQASAVHQVIQALRRGKVGTEPNDKVIIGGHSMGSAITALEASTYHDVDGVLLTGVSHHLNQVNVAAFFATGVRPAMLDPALSSRGDDPGYLTTRPGARKTFFYQPGTADPGVEEADERTKDVLSATEVSDGIATISTPMSRSIDVPVMLANGSRDKVMCDFGTNCATAATLKATEELDFSPAARLRTFVLPGFGHAINLAPNAPDYQRAVVDWATTIADPTRT